MITRRETLQAAGIAIAATGIVGTAAGGHSESQPEHVHIRGLDEARQILERYQPLLRTSHLEVKPTALYGLTASSPEYDYDWCVYWAEYSHQEGVSPDGRDSHLGDHEPIYVGVEKKSADVARILYSGYHWLKAEAVSMPLYEQTHPALEVIGPWHHYALDAKKRGQYVDLKDLTQAIDSWLANGLEDDLAPGTVRDPESMRYREYWWRKNLGPFSTTAASVRVSLGLAKLFGDAQTDL